MKVATFNVNSIRARLPVLSEWLRQTCPDVVALQETKVEDGKFPIEEIEKLGYHAAFHGQQKYNGVALLAVHPIEDVQYGFEDEAWPQDCRLISAVVRGVTVINTYVPNGSAVGSEKFDYKLRWFDRFGQYLEKLAETSDSMIWMGDINVAPSRDDVFDPDAMEGRVCFHPDEREKLKSLLSWGWVDCFRMFNKEPGQFSYWEYFIPNGFKRNLGWRIDHIYASPGLARHCKNCVIDKVPRGWERPSDHTPVIADFDLA